MNNLSKVKTNLKNNFNLWMALWFLLLLNAYTFIVLIYGFSWGLTIFFLILVLLGMGLLRLVIQDESQELITLPELKASISGLMREITPLCDDIFIREANRAINPITEELEKEFSKGLNWLWENIDTFLSQIVEHIDELESVSQLISSLSSEQDALLTEFNGTILGINEVVLQVQQTKADDLTMLLDKLDFQKDNLMETMESEKEVFYQHIYNILLEHSEKEDDFNPVEHFNTYKLGEQFAELVNKSFQEKAEEFNDIAIEHLAEFSSDIVGRMQKNMANLLNALRDNQAVLDRLLYDCKGESHLLLRRIDELLVKNNNIQEKASEILVTLAWQDILVEKRWQEVKNTLYLERDLVQNSVEQEVLDYIKELVEQQIPGISYNVKQAEGALFYKSLLDAELIYQIYRGQKLSDILDNGVKVLMQFVRPVEILAQNSVRLYEQGVQMRKGLRQGVKSGEYDEVFQKVKNLTAGGNAQISAYIADIFPREFYAFLNSPYIKKKPENLSSAAWSIFLSLLGNDAGDEIYSLTGLLLLVHTLRNKYINPLKNELIELQDDVDIEIMRDSVYLIINLIMRNELRGTISLTYKFK